MDIIIYMIVVIMNIIADMSVAVIVYMITAVIWL